MKLRTITQNLLKKLCSYFPSPLPVGRAEYEKWIKDILDLAGNVADEDSMRWAVNNIVPHLGPSISKVPKNYFVRSLRKAAANQVAAAMTMEIKERQAAKIAAAAQQQTVEATTTQPSAAVATINGKTE